MSYENNNVDKDDIENLRMKILAIGMYEIGMSVQEMKDLLELVQQSEQTASQETEYRSTLLETENTIADNNILGRRACNLKRIMYQESSSDDETSILNQKSKEVLPKYLQDKIGKASARKRMQINDYKSHADKIFDDLIVQGDQKESNNKSKHVYNRSSSSDDDISLKTIISVHHEKTPVKMLRDKKKTVKSKNTEDLGSISSANDILCPSETNEECHSMQTIDKSSGNPCFYCQEYITGNYEEHIENCENNT